MSYQVTFTETTNPAKPALTVADQTLNSQTSLTFVGKNYAGYAPVVANNFLHLLENFANNTAPANPIEGQLWYDNTSGVNLLKVFDGAIWTSAGSVKKAGSAPLAANSNPGDLWVNTTTSQLYVFSGSNWLLVGPQFSSGSLTGTVVDTIVDTSNVTHNVISLYANNYRLAIISKETFTPKSTIVGFTTVNQGFNLSTVDSTNTTDLSRIWGTASNADALLVTGVSIPSANFLRSDVSSTSNFPLTIRADGGLTIGSNSSFNIGRDGTSTVLYSKSSGDSVDIRLNNNSVPVTVVHIDALSRVGIGSNNTAPTATLDVAGTVNASGDLLVTSTTDATGTVVGTLGGSIKTLGGIAVQKNIVIGKNAYINGKLYLDTLDTVTGVPTPGSVILPTTTGIYDIGSSTASFRNVYADTFSGNFTGTFTGTLQGSISGSAARLASPTVFSMQGDVSSDNISFTGQSSLGIATFTTTINQNFISNKTTVDDSLLSDTLLVYRAGSVNLVKMTKETLLKHVATVPVGAIMPYAGTIVPDGYLLCDGSEVRTSEYSALYGVIGYTYKSATLLQGIATFALPDLRGRFPLGRDNMDNEQRIPSRDDASILIDAGGGAANRVTDVTADIVGTGAGAQTITLTVNNLPDHKHNLSSTAAQYYAGGLPGGASDTAAVPGNGLPNSSTGSGLPNSGGIISSTLGAAVTVMNPYTTINYIIFTGVL